MEKKSDKSTSVGASLLPCPFCGSIPEIPRQASCQSIPLKAWKDCEKWGIPKSHFGLTASIRCSNCGVSVLGKIGKPTDALAVKEAIRIWNTRIT